MSSLKDKYLYLNINIYNYLLSFQEEKSNLLFSLDK